MFFGTLNPLFLYLPFCVSGNDVFDFHLLLLPLMCCFSSPLCFPPVVLVALFLLRQYVQYLYLSFHPFSCFTGILDLEWSIFKAHSIPLAQVLFLRILCSPFSVSFSFASCFQSSPPPASLSPASPSEASSAQDYLTCVCALYALNVTFSLPYMFCFGFCLCCFTCLLLLFWYFVFIFLLPTKTCSMISTVFSARNRFLFFNSPVY